MNTPSVPSKVERYYLQKAQTSFFAREDERIPVVTAPNYVVLGQLTALRFIEWIGENPEGVVALPTGKTPEYFIKWFHYYRNNWERECNEGVVAEIGIGRPQPPSCKGLHFVQIDEFFPIDSNHERSFNYYVRRFYIDGFGFDPHKALLIDTNTLPEEIKAMNPGGKSIEEALDGELVDFGLRFRQVSHFKERVQQKIIRHYDTFCQEYEFRIRELGGIGFFLGGIGPDGHVAFNVRGSSHLSTTRLTTLNYESMVAAAQDLGGIESVRKKAVITIGLGTITCNPEVVAIIFAAGEAKASVVADALEHPPQLDFPASALQPSKNARFYLTNGAASKLKKRRITSLLVKPELSEQELQRLVIDGALGAQKKLSELNDSDAQSEYAFPGLWHSVKKIADADLEKVTTYGRQLLREKIDNGLTIPHNNRILHTGPHHDDIELAYFPLVHHLVRSAHIDNYFCYLTSGFTSVTNSHVLQRLRTTRDILLGGQLFGEFSRGELTNATNGAHEIHGYLNAIAKQNREEQNFFASARLCRTILGYLQTDSIEQLQKFVDEQIGTVRTLYPGALDPEPIRYIKSWIREWEAETVWAHFGLGLENVHHLRLKFYSGDIFPHDPKFTRDVVPVLDLLKRIKPTIITLALDPEGSGPDTHYKCLMALRAAIETYKNDEQPESLEIWGYRNVWSRFHPADVSTIIPVSLNSFAVLHNMFNTCFVSQKTASFPSFELDGTFSELAQKIWTDQFNDLTKLLGKSMFYENMHPMMRRAYGAIYLQKMNYKEFMEVTAGLEVLENDKRSLLMQ